VSETRLKLLIAYDGRPFRGWQSQATGDAAQDFLEAAFKKLVGQRVAVIGSGRTDAGVHALAQVAHVDVPRDRLPLAKWAAALNAHLPPEIRVLKAAHALPGFHAQFHATGKIYAYRVWNGPALHPLEIGRVWFVRRLIDLARLRACAQMFVGTHDFASFAANRRRPEPDTVRTIESIRITHRGPLIVLRFAGSGFLYRMVRLLTGTLVRCAQHRLEPSFICDLLATPGRKKTHYCAPAEGLYLTRVLYARTTARR
jgi:tRNA pseudouridine38-40 synthase